MSVQLLFCLMSNALNKMSFQLVVMGVILPLVTVTGFWLIVGAGGPFIVPKGPNRGLSLFIQLTKVDKSSPRLALECCSWLELERDAVTSA